MNELKLITEWFIRGGRICGFCNGGPIGTSPVVSLEGDVVTTKSGSTYQLGEVGQWDELRKLLNK